MEKLKLWYRKEAENWEEALPVGNGRLGGMVLERQKGKEFNSMKTRSGMAAQRTETILMPWSTLRKSAD